jgi:hypothetical protein
MVIMVMRPMMHKACLHGYNRAYRYLAGLAPPDYRQASGDDDDHDHDHDDDYGDEDVV